MQFRGMNSNVDIISDGITVWVNSETACLGRFGRQGIDVHTVTPGTGGGSECLYCTHGLTIAADWDVFVAKMLEHHGVLVAAKYRPDRFNV